MCGQRYLEGYTENTWDLTGDLSSNQTTMLFLSGSRTNDRKDSVHCSPNTWNYGAQYMHGKKEWGKGGMKG